MLTKNPFYELDKNKGSAQLPPACTVLLLAESRRTPYALLNQTTLGLTQYNDALCNICLYMNSHLYRLEEGGINDRKQQSEVM